MNKSVTLTPGPDVYNNQKAVIGQLKSMSEALNTAIFKAKGRAEMENTQKDDKPGPGSYDVHVDHPQQVGLASHFARTLGRDFSQKEKLKLIVDRKQAVPLNFIVNEDKTNIGPGSYFKEDLSKSQRIQQQQQKLKLLRQSSSIEIT